MPPGLKNALNAVASGEADGIIVAHLARLSRLMTLQEVILASVWGHGGKAFTADADEVLRNDDDPMRAAMRQMAGVFAQLERSMTAKRMRDGRRLKAERGGFAYGSPPYGMTAEGKQLVPVPAEQAAIRRAVELRDAGLSLRKIGAVLEQKGYPAKRGGSWTPMTVSRILARAS